MAAFLYSASWVIAFPVIVVATAVAAKNVSANLRNKAASLSENCTQLAVSASFSQGSCRFIVRIPVFKSLFVFPLVGSGAGRLCSKAVLTQQVAMKLDYMLMRRYLPVNVADGQYRGSFHVQGNVVVALVH